MPYNQLKKFMVKKLKHDALVKKILTEKIAAQEFLEYYLPIEFKSLVDLTKIKSRKRIIC